MRRYVLGFALSFTAIFAAGAQQTSRCSGDTGMPLDSLFADARRLHPDVAKPENQTSTVVIGLVYDNHCKLLRHAMRRVPDRSHVDTIMGQVFPDSTRLTMDNFEISGFASYKT